MSEQTPSAEERARDAIRYALEPPTVCNEYIESWIDCGIRDILSQFTAANLTLIDTEELAQLRADLDVAMRFFAAWRHRESLRIGFVADSSRNMAQGQVNEALDALYPAYERWQAEQARGEETG